VVIDASGVVETMCPQGTRLSILIRPSVADRSPEPVWTIPRDDRIDLTLEPGACDRGTVGPPRDRERTLPIGPYDVAVSRELLSDTVDPASPAPSGPIQLVSVCVASFEVTTRTSRVRILADFDAAITEFCAITVEAE
jgi:hypothetical protein